MKTTCFRSCVVALMASAFFALTACVSTTSPRTLPDKPIYKPVPERQPEFTGDYVLPEDVDRQPAPAGTLPPSAYPPERKRDVVVDGETFTVVRQDGGALARMSPVYPPELKQYNVSGDALIAFIVTTDGTTDQVQVVKATHRGFADAAVESIKKWRYTPATKNGKPVNCRMQIPITFYIGD